MKLIAPILLVWATATVADHELEGRDVLAGSLLYAEHCASCHGADLEGQPDWRSPNDDGVLPAPPHDATGHTWHHDNVLLFEYTKLGGKRALAALTSMHIRFQICKHSATVPAPSALMVATWLMWP